jgi:hypothetical protein
VLRSWLRRLSHKTRVSAWRAWVGHVYEEQMADAMAALPNH